MSDGKIIASVTIPCGVVLVFAICFILVRANTGTPDSAAQEVRMTSSPNVTARSSGTSALTSIRPVTQSSAVDRPEGQGSKSNVTPSPAGPQPPKPFRGLDWGNIISQRSDMVPAEFQQDAVNVNLEGNQAVEIKNVHIRSYQRSGDKLQFGPEPVGGIEYEAVDNRFYQVKIQDPNPFNLSTVFSQVYGKAAESKIGNSRFWEWDADDGQTNILMCYEPPSNVVPNGLSWAQLTNVALAKRLVEIQKAEALSELNKARKDF